MAAHTIPTDNQCPSQGRNLHTTISPCTWKNDAWFYTIRAEATAIREHLSSDLCGFFIRLLTACKQRCLLAGVGEWSFNLHCSLKRQGCKHRRASSFAARTRAPRICWLGRWKHRKTHFGSAKPASSPQRRALGGGVVWVVVVSLTSLMLISASTYWSPFWRMEMSAAGGTSVPLMLDWLMWLSIPKVKAEWEKPGSRKRKPWHGI